MASYDAEIIYKFADRLYAQARSAMVVYTLIGAILGGAAGYWLMFQEFSEWTWPATGVGALLGALLGLAVGRERAFRLKLAAQVALCQVKIEENTRGG